MAAGNDDVAPDPWLSANRFDPIRSGVALSTASNRLAALGALHARRYHALDRFASQALQERRAQGLEKRERAAAARGAGEAASEAAARAVRAAAEAKAAAEEAAEVAKAAGGKAAGPLAKSLPGKSPNKSKGPRGSRSKSTKSPKSSGSSGGGSVASASLAGSLQDGEPFFEEEGDGGPVAVRGRAGADFRRAGRLFKFRRLGWTEVDPFECSPWQPEALDPRLGMLGGANRAAMRADKVDLEAPAMALSAALELNWEPFPPPKEPS